MGNLLKPRALVPTMIVLGRRLPGGAAWPLLVGGSRICIHRGHAVSVALHYCRRRQCTSCQYPCLHLRLTVSSKQHHGLRLHNAKAAAPVPVPPHPPTHAPTYTLPQQLSGRIPFDRFEALMSAAAAATEDINDILTERLKERTIQLLQARGE
jgi:hypothetical protein